MHFKSRILFWQAQFLIILFHLSLLLAFNCAMPKGLTMYMYIQCIIFIALFSNFYVQAYIKNDSRSDDLKKNLSLNVCSLQSATIDSTAGSKKFDWIFFLFLSPDGGRFRGPGPDNLN